MNLRQGATSRLGPGSGVTMAPKNQSVRNEGRGGPGPRRADTEGRWPGDIRGFFAR